MQVVIAGGHVQIALGGTPSEADADLGGRDLDLDWTILRPGGLTNGPPTGRVQFELISGDTPIAAALAGLQ